MKRILKTAIVMTVLTTILSGCHLYGNNYLENVREYAMISDSGDFSALDQYPNLEYVDFRGSTCYEEILTYADNHPNVTVRYNVQLGERRFDAAVTEIVLNGYETDFDLLLKNLKYLTNLQNVQLNQITFTREQIDVLTSTYGDISFAYTVELCGRRYDHLVNELNLTHLTSDDIDNAIKAISLLPELKMIKLSDYTDESNLTISDVKSLTVACPGVNFDYKFILFNKTISTLDEELAFDTVEIGNEGIERVREALDIMRNCVNVRLDSCGIDNEVMAQLRSDYPDSTVAWRVFAGRFSMMTDEEMLRMPYSLKDSEAAVLKYCNKVKYLDVQGSKITNIDFISNMPNLECVVLTQTNIGDISPLANCPNLTWLEISTCSAVKDLSPLSGLGNLKYLNISNTRVSDLSALDELPLERFNCVKSAVKDAALEAFVAKHPNCHTVSKGYALDYGWRFEDKKATQMFPYYAQMYEIFRYGEKSFSGNTKEN